MNLHINWLIILCFISLIFTFTLASLQLHIFRTQGIGSMEVIERDIVFSLTCLCLVLKCWRCCLTSYMLTVSSWRLGYKPVQKSLLLLFDHSIWRAFCILCGIFWAWIGRKDDSVTSPSSPAAYIMEGTTWLSVCLHLLPPPGDGLHSPR